jgi:hypothetical protein
VEAAFREQYSQINLMAERTAVAGEGIQSDGAWRFIRVLLERIAGEEAALACSAGFQRPFNQECQSVVTISDARKQQAKVNRPLVRDKPVEKMTLERFASLFEVSRENREGGSTVVNSNPKNNSTTLRELFRKIGSVERGDSNG